MKRNLVIMAGLALAVAGYFAANLFAQGPGQAVAVKVGVINIDTVFVNYDKARGYKKELDDMIAPFKGEAEKLKKSIVEYQDYLKHPKTPQEPAKREPYEKAILDYRRKLEDLDRDVRKLIGKKQEDQLVVLYKEVVGATQAYAQANGYGMVFGYGEPFEKTDLFTFANISRKMQGMGLGIVPIWYNGSLDITDAVVATLNHHHRSVQGGAVANPGSK